MYGAHETIPDSVETVKQRFRFGVQLSQACSQCCRYLGYCVKDGQVCLIRLRYEQTLAAAVRGMWERSSLGPMQRHLLHGYCAKQTQAAIVALQVEIGLKKKHALLACSSQKLCSSCKLGTLRIWTSILKPSCWISMETHTSHTQTILGLLKSCAVHGLEKAWDNGDRLTCCSP